MVFLRLYFWIIPHLLLAVCLVKLLRMGLHRQFPVFIAYLSFEELHFLVLLILNLLVLRSHSLVLTYHWTLVVGVVTAGVLQLASLYEISAFLVTRHSPAARTLWPLLRWGCALFVVMAGAVSGSISQSGIQRVTSAFEVLNFSASVINIGMLIVLLAFSKVFHLTWRSVAAGFVLGFGVNSSIEVAAMALMASIGPKSYVAMDLIRMAGFHVCVVVWVIYVFRPEKSAQAAGRSLPKVDLEFWNEKLQRLVD
jgi:hypothetical protein